MTKYGEITTEQFQEYRTSLINRVWALLPMKEESSNTIRQYVENLNRELIMNVDIFERCERVLTVVCLLESVAKESDHDIYRRDILRCCRIISGLGDKDV